MRKIAVLFLSLLFVFLGFSMAQAATVDLFDWAFNIDGTDIYEGGAGYPGAPFPPIPDLVPGAGGFDWVSGLGTLNWSTSVAGSHSFIAFFDHEIDEATNTFFNEYGERVNTPEIIQSWEIDEPGYVFGDIYDNVLAGSLDNSNDVPAGFEDDVSWAMGWDFTLTADESALVKLILSDTAPTSFGLYLAQTDPNSNETIYFSSDIAVGPTEVIIPEPATMILLGTGLAGLLGIRRKKFRK